MDLDAVFTAVGQERVRVAHLVEGLAEHDLDHPSLCAGWPVRTVAAHLAVAARGGMGPLLLAILRTGSPHRANTLLARRQAQLGVAATVELLRSRSSSRWAPPVVGPLGPLTDLLVHTGDMCRPLGRTHEHDAEHVLAALGFVTGGRAVGFVPKGRLDGLAVRADDVGFAAGEGAALTGRGVDLLMAACGRVAALDDVAGPGVPVLRARLEP